MSAVPEREERAGSRLSARWRWLLFGVVLVACSTRYLARADLVLDDAFIYLDLARNWVAGHGPRFNPGDSHLPASSPGWVMLLAATKLVLPGVGWEPLAVGLTFAALVAACIPLHQLLAARHPLAAAAAPIAIFCAPSVLGLCGHDTNLATAAGLWLLAARQARWWRLLGPLAALVYLARAEGAALGAAVLLSAALAQGWRTEPVVRQLRALAGGLVVGALLVALWHGYFALEFGALLPSTLAAKLAAGRAGWTTFGEALPDRLQASVGHALLAAPGAVALALHVPGLVAWAALHCGLLSLSGIAAYHWYFYPLELALLGANLVGLDLAAGLLLRVLSRAGQRAVLAPLVAIATLAVAWGLYPGEDPGFASMHERRDTYRDAAAWMAARAPAEPGRRPRLLTDEIGALAFFLPGFEVRDTVGLALPVSGPPDVNNVPRAVQLVDPDFLVLPGPPGRVERLVVCADGWHVFTVGYRPKPGVPGRAVMLASDDHVPRDSPTWRLIELARLTRHPLQVTGALVPVEVPGVGTCLRAQAPSVLALELAGPGSQQVLLGFGLEDASWQGDGATDGVSFAVEAVGADGAADRIFTRTLRPVAEPADRGVQGATVALPRGTASLRLITESAGGPRSHGAYWAAVLPSDPAR